MHGHEATAVSLGIVDHKAGLVPDILSRNDRLIIPIPEGNGSESLKVGRRAAIFIGPSPR